MSKLICLIKGHLWSGGTFVCFDGYGVDRKFCGRCYEERSFVE